MRNNVVRTLGHLKMLLSNFFFYVKACSARAPIVTAGMNMLTASSSLISSAKSLAVNPRDAATWQLLASHSKAVSDAIRKLEVV